jgi:hypothetical protein
VRYDIYMSLGGEGLMYSAFPFITIHSRVPGMTLNDVFVS